MSTHIADYVYDQTAESDTQCAGMVIVREPHKRKTRIRCIREPAEGVFDPETHKLFNFCTQHYQAIERGMRIAKANRYTDEDMP